MVNFMHYFVLLLSSAMNCITHTPSNWSNLSTVISVLAKGRHSHDQLLMSALVRCLHLVTIVNFTETGQGEAV